MPGAQSAITFQSAGVSRQAIGTTSGISYDAASNSYTVVYGAATGGPGGSGGARTLVYGSADVNSTAGNFTTFQHADPGDPAYADRFRVSKLGAANSQIALTYTQWAIQDVGNGTNFLDRTYFVFGTPVTSLPTTGTASFNGIVDGTYYRASDGQTFLLSGTSTLSADFAAGTVGTAINFTGANVVTGQPGLAALALSGNGVISATNANGQFNGTLTSGGLPGSAVFYGNFYGPGAQEFGYAFVYTGATDQFSGIAVGKR